MEVVGGMVIVAIALILLYGSAKESGGVTKERSRQAEQDAEEQEKYDEVLKRPNLRGRRLVDSLRIWVRSREK